ncbi:TetR family transcriptional regulator [Actinocrispum wychmicini]|uniref:TetR family transcriptional regulator n=1 Tax=Actinocrispum wychmicini TaxID=1213861 RepID=UPI001FB776B5|nr:TetR family transcriptional regulator [Actinocrispum wychmicini]
MSKRDPEATRRKLLTAGLGEFAEHGIAGARVERIAKSAGFSAGLVYTYFTGKEDLFESVFDTFVKRAEFPITADDLPGYAGRLFDAGQADPEVVRLVEWHRLERPGQVRPAVLEATIAKVAAIRAAQATGRVSARLAAEQLLHLIVQLATDATPGPVHRMMNTAARRAAVVEAVRRVVEP